MDLVSPGESAGHLLGEPYPRRLLAGGVLGVLGLASVAFLLGLDLGLYGFGVGWFVIALGLALLAGRFQAGVLPTVGCLWLITLWWFVFPPLVGYLTGEWAMASRYNHPRLLGSGYTSARAELIGGLEYGLRAGFFVGAILGTTGYAAGLGISRLQTRTA